MSNKTKALSPDVRRAPEAPDEGDMFKTPLPFTIPSFLVGASMAFDLGATLRPDSFERFVIEQDDFEAILGDFVVVGDDVADAVSAASEEFEGRKRKAG